MLLISEYALDCRNYNETKEDVTWETCSLRKWLNEDFYQSAFTVKEKLKIQKVTLDNSYKDSYLDYEQWQYGGNDTADRIFILSENEFNKYFINSDITGSCEPTTYAVSNGAFVSDDSYGVIGATMWWIRTPGARQDYAKLIMTYSEIKKDGAPVNRIYSGGEEFFGVCVRPAMWISID